MPYGRVIFWNFWLIFPLILVIGYGISYQNWFLWILFAVKGS